MKIRKHWLAPGSIDATPYYEFISGNHGPSIMIIAGIHGNETASVAAARQLAADLKRGGLALRKGKLIIVPLVNRKAYRKKIRGKPDLNRQFPRNFGKKGRNRLARSLFELAAKSAPGWFLDLHEANGLSQLSRKVLGQTLITNPGSPAIPVLRRRIKGMNAGIKNRSHYFNLRLHELPGSSRTAAARLIGSKAVTVETCWSLPRATRIRYQKQLVRGILQESGLL